MKHQRTKLLIASTLLAALGSSLCCILPFIAFILGASGVVSAPWIAALRPCLAVLSVLTLGFAWYRQLRHQEHQCAPQRPPSFLGSKIFLGIMTGLSLTMLSFPYYAIPLYPSVPSTGATIEEKNIEEGVLKIAGMHCAGCEKAIRQALHKLPGIISTTASYKKGTIHVRFEKAKTAPQEIQRAIQAIGYNCSPN